MISIRFRFRRSIPRVPIVLLLFLGPSGCFTAPTDGLPRTGSGTGNLQGFNSGGGTPAISAQDATLLEQLSLERINRARLRPGPEAARFGIAIDEGIPGQLDAAPRQAVAMNGTLRSIARRHSEDMLNRNFFEHVNPDGLSPFDRMRNGGYLFTAGGENLAWRGTTGSLDPETTVEGQHVDLFVDTPIPDRGHRVTMLLPPFREVGIAIVRGSFTRSSDGTVFSDSIMQTQDYGATPSDNTIVLGVVYADRNENGQYDFGEGVENSTVTLGGIVKSTNRAGGYSFEVFEPNTYELRFASGRTQTVTVQQGDPNIKVDSVDGVLVTNLGIGLLN